MIMTTITISREKDTRGTYYKVLVPGMHPVAFTALFDAFTHVAGDKASDLLTKFAPEIVLMSIGRKLSIEVEIS